MTTSTITDEQCGATAAKYAFSRRAGTAALLVLSVATLAACSSSGNGSASSSAAPSSAASSSAASSSAASSSTSGATGANGGGQGFGGRGGAAAAGKIAEITGNVLQVQSTTSQTAVKVTAKTRYTERATTSASAVKDGECITAVAAPKSTAGGSASPSSPTSGAVRKTPTTLAAATVLISTPANGSCAAGGFGRGPNGTPTGSRTGAFPSGAFPSGARPSGALRSGAGRFDRIGEIVAGKVTAVSGGTITVSVTVRNPATQTSAPPTSSTVTTTSATVFTHTVAATKASLKVGLCAQAFGAASTTGAVTATRMSLSSPTAGQCQTGFGFAGRR